MLAYQLLQEELLPHRKTPEQNGKENGMLNAMTPLFPRTHLNLGNLSFRNKPLLALITSMRFGSKKNT